MIVLGNPCRAAGFAYCHAIKEHTKHSIVALWSSKEMKDLWANATPNDMIDYHVISNPFWLHWLDSIGKPDAFIPCDDATFPLCNALQMRFHPENCNVKNLHLYSKLDYLKDLYNAGLLDDDLFSVGSNSIPEFSGKMILKPAHGQGSENVFVVNTPYEVRELLKDKSEPYILQTFLDGPEYSVELCSSGNNHRCTAIQTYEEQFEVNGGPWRESNVTVDPTGLEHIIDYVKSVVTHLGIRVGMTWTQVRIVNGKPQVIECNFRQMGLGNHVALYSATGMCYSTEALRAYLSPLSFVDFSTYKKIGNFRKIFLNNKRERYIESIDYEPIKSLPSVKNIWSNDWIIPGTVPVSDGFKNGLAVIITVHEDDTIFEEDYKKIKEWRQTIDGTIPN
jgi:hypothetical protein